MNRCLLPILSTSTGAGTRPISRTEHDATGHALIYLNGEADPARAVDLAQGAPAATLIE
jgi:hypothetical protein